MELINLIRNTSVFFFICYIVILSDIFANNRQKITTYIKKRIVQDTDYNIGEKLLYIMNCPFCLTFWLSVAATFFGLISPVYCLVYPSLVFILWKATDLHT